METDFVWNSGGTSGGYSSSAAFAGNGYVTEVEAASKKAKPKLNKTKISVKTGKTYTLKVNGTTRMPKWKSSNKKVATVSKTGKVTAKKAGTARLRQRSVKPD